MKPSFGSAYLDDNKTLIQQNTLHFFSCYQLRLWGWSLFENLIINIRASKNISGLVNVTVTSPAGLVKFFLNVEPCIQYHQPYRTTDISSHHQRTDA